VGTKGNAHSRRKALIDAVKLLFTASPRFFILSFVLTGVSASLPYVVAFSLKGLLNLLSEILFGSASVITSTANAIYIQHQVLAYCIFYCSLLVFRSILSSLTKIINYKYNDEVKYYLDNLLVDKMSQIDLAYFDSHMLRDKMMYANSHFTSSTQYMLRVIFNTIEKIISIGAAAALLVQWFSLFALLSAIIIVPAFIFERIMQKREQNFDIEHVSTSRRLTYFAGLFMGETLKEMQLYNTAAHFIEKYKTLWNKWHRERSKLNIISCVMDCSFLVLTTLCDSAAYLYAVVMLANGSLGVGDVAFYVSVLSMFRSRLVDFITTIVSFDFNTQQFDLVREFIEMEPVVEKSGTLAPSARPRIEFRDVSFKYPNAENWVLQNCSFVVEPGETVGLVGLNGSGKSTIVKLICRFYDPTEGAVLIDGVDAREYDIAKLRALYGALFQDFCMYSFTLRESIALSDLSRINDDTAILDACEKSNVTEFINDWEKGIDEELTRQFNFDGKELSIGQWQRVALARTFFRDAPVALLDEPSASLDPIAEHDIFTKFSQLADKKSALLISHRLSSITIADRILVLEDGHIIESGTHFDLLRQNGRYAYLFNLQASKYINDDTESVETEVQ